MEFTDEPLEPFGEKLLEMSVPTQLSFKTPLVFRMVKELKARGCLPWTGSHRAELCFDEALTNAMVHGNKLDPSRKVHVKLFADSENWGAIIEDQGDGFKPEDVPSAESDDFLFRESGRGILLMSAYLDTLRYTRKGNKLCMVRHRQVEPEEAEVEAAVETEAAPAAAMGPVNIMHDDGIDIIEILAARVNDENVDPIREAISKLVTGRVLLDMTHTEYISSVGLSALVAIYKQSKLKGGRLALTGVQPAVKDILQGARLISIFRIFPDRATAVKELRKDE